MEIPTAVENRKEFRKNYSVIVERDSGVFWATVVGMETPEGCRVEKAERVTVEVMGDGEL